MSYKNFKVAMYFRVIELNEITDLDVFAEKFKFIEKYVDIDKVYLETWRGSETITREKLVKIKEFFNKKGIKTSGGITPIPVPEGEGSGNGAFCYNNAEHRTALQSVVEFTSSIFDELILDDFFYTNCRCEACIKGMGDSTWSEYRLATLKQASQDIVIGPAKKVNPKVNLIIKYPNWYENFQETGYNLEEEPKMFDMIYAGTESRNTQYTQQHLPRYLSYFMIRYMENVKPGKNGGGWFDPYTCEFNLGSYLEQLHLTLLAKAREGCMFCYFDYTEVNHKMVVPMAGLAYEEIDKVLEHLGNPVGTTSYVPYHSCGEDFLHNYLGMSGMPIEPTPEYPTTAKNVFLSENATKDKNIIEKIKKSLIDGNNVIVTSGFLKATQDEGFASIANVRVTDRKQTVSKFALSDRFPVPAYVVSEKPITIPELAYHTNDTWQLASGLGVDNNFSIIVKVEYGNGYLYVVNIPEDFGDLYYYPKEVLLMIRMIMNSEAIVTLDAPGRVGLFTYDNDTFVVQSFLPYNDYQTFVVNRPNATLESLQGEGTITGETKGNKTYFKVYVFPSSYKAYKIK